MVGANVHITDYKRVQGNPKDRYSYAMMTTTFGFDLIVINKIAKHDWEIIADLIDDALVHETIHLVLCEAEIGFEANRKLDNILPDLQSLNDLCTRLERIERK